MLAIESRQVDIDGKVSQVLTSTAANTEALQELKSLLCTYMGKFKTTEEGSPSVTKAPIDIEVPISSSAVIPDQTKRTEVETNCSVEDCLEFRDTDQGLCQTSGTPTIFRKRRCRIKQRQQRQGVTPERGRQCRISGPLAWKQYRNWLHSCL
jgi:hypothetical protein